MNTAEHFLFVYRVDHTWTTAGVDIRKGCKWFPTPFNNENIIALVIFYNVEIVISFIVNFSAHYVIILYEVQILERYNST